MQDPNAYRVYFHCSFEYDINSDVIDLTAEDSDVSDDDASDTSDELILGHLLPNFVTFTRYFGTFASYSSTLRCY
jgi:hypothetical protein